MKLRPRLFPILIVVLLPLIGCPSYSCASVVYGPRRSYGACFGGNVGRPQLR